MGISMKKMWMILLMMVVVGAFAGCGVSGKGGDGDEEISGMAAEDVATETSGDSSSDLSGKVSGTNKSNVFSKANTAYKADIDTVAISFSSIDGLEKLEPVDAMEMGIIHQTFYYKDAKHSIDVGYVPAKYAPSSGYTRTAEEFKNYPWDETVTPLTVYVAEDVSVDGWSGFYFEYHDDSMDFNSSGYELFNEEGAKVMFSQIESEDGYLPIEDIRIQ